MEMTEKLLTDCATILRVSNISPDINHSVKIATRGYYYVSKRICVPSLKQKWNGMACDDLEQYYDQSNEERQGEIRQIRGIQKLLNIELILDSYGLYSKMIKKTIAEHNLAKAELTGAFVASLFEVIFMEFYVPPYDKQLLVSLKECVQMAGVRIDDVHKRLIQVWLESVPVNTEAIKAVMEISNRSSCAEILLNGLHKVSFHLSSTDSNYLEVTRWARLSL